MIHSYLFFTFKNINELEAMYDELEKIEKEGEIIELCAAFEQLKIGNGFEYVLKRYKFYYSN